MLHMRALSRQGAVASSQKRFCSMGGFGKGSAPNWSVGAPTVDVTGTHKWGTFRNQNMWRWNDNWWRDRESHITVIYRKTHMRQGFAGEEIHLPREQAEEALNAGIAVLPDYENQNVVYCWNPETQEYDFPVERTPELLRQIARKRQWVDTYWRIHDAYLETWRQTTGWSHSLCSPIDANELSRLLWQQAQVRIDPSWIRYRFTNRPLGIMDIGHTWAWVVIPGGEDIAAPHVVYHNTRVKLRIHIRRDHKAPY
eukprot:TRINITY_DN15061_c0_g1_i1.p1 TRINITY_DN15061_c0_g1~~TRINITY_DN15061_c0_g1_i1.p1  ORF type:complete len:254 (+),score=64.72 TRINITY_DN15061_c0_g1_i1:75-836(+)